MSSVGGGAILDYCWSAVSDKSGYLEPFPISFVGVSTGVCNSRGTRPSKTAREASFRLTRRDGRRLDCRNDCSGRGLRIRSPYPADEGRLTVVKANASAVMFTGCVSQREDFRVFTVAVGTTRDSKHGELLLRNSHLPMIIAA